MRRQFRSPDEIAEAAVRKLAWLSQSPLQPVYEKLTQLIAEAVCAVQANSTLPNGVERLCRCIGIIGERLPQTFGRRFHLDACLIQALFRDMRSATRVSSMVVPRYGSGWGHERLPMPSEDRDRAHVIDLIHFPGQDQIGDVDLLDYPWLFHELVHCILSIDDSTFAQPFARKLEALTRSMRLASIADRGAARVRSHQKLEEMVQLWRPVPSHKNWSHELAIDVISLWLCGPAYLAAFADVVSQPDVNPYKIVQDHPPYAVRTRALIDAAADLGFADYTADLCKLERSWRKSKWDRKRDSRFLNLANRDLISECTRRALVFCEHSKLQKCTPQGLDRVRSQVRHGIEEIPDSDQVGIDLVLAAWLIHRERGENAYKEWMTRRLEGLSALITQLSR